MLSILFCYEIKCKTYIFTQENQHKDVLLIKWLWCNLVGFHLQAMDDAYSKGKHAMPTNIHTQVMQCLKIIIFSHCIHSSLFCRTKLITIIMIIKSLYVRSNLAHGLRYETLIETKKYLHACHGFHAVAYQVHDIWIEERRQETSPLHQPWSPKIQQSLSSFQTGTTSQTSKLGIPRW